MQNIPGAYVDVAELTSFAYIAYLAAHPEGARIFRSPITAFLAEGFPEKDPSRADVGFRVDFVGTRLDGSAVRIHPHRSREAQVTESTLEEWRSGSIPIADAVSKVYDETVWRRQLMFLGGRKELL